MPEHIPVQLEFNPFEAGQRIRVHWANDNSILEGDLTSSRFEHPDDLAFGWAGQLVQFIEGATQSLTFIFAKDDATIEILE